MPKKLTTEEFIKKAKLIHEIVYDYSLSEYKTTQSKIKIICLSHGEFLLPACKHLQGRGCPVCSGNKITTKEFIDRAAEIHGDKYDYSLVDYEFMHSKIKVICSEHGEFEQTPDRHLTGGCNQCARKEYGKNKTLSNEEFIARSNSIHEFKYDYSLVKYKHSREKVFIICPTHGEFEQMPTNHLAGKGCIICGESKGEKQIRKFLKENKINFISQKKFKDCRNKLPLPFDFYLPKLNVCVEYDGKQHFKVVNHFGGKKGFDARVKNDQIKNDYCKNNNIKLIRIKFDSDINEVLTRNFQQII